MTHHLPRDHMYNFYAPLLPLMSLPLLSATKPKPSKGAMRSKPSPSLSKSVSFSDMRLLKQRRVEMLASVAVQSFSQSSELQPLEFNPFLDQCLLGGLLEVGRPGYAAEHRAAAEGSVFDPAGLLEEDEVFEKGLFDMSINNGRLGLLAAAITGAEPEEEFDEEELLMSLWYLKKRRGYHSFPTHVKGRRYFPIPRPACVRL
ncbi:unnamed protein product [Symbiodinium natans]|uniref:Uncharacterized protein n=1 Tax=Symbiodinium natans TaxID=878477 RepID=A0A812T1A6_9DINO|nr:unnamed protein product [Symbiodinium natans]